MNELIELLMKIDDFVGPIIGSLVLFNTLLLVLVLFRLDGIVKNSLRAERWSEFSHEDKNIVAAMSVKYSRVNRNIVIFVWAASAFYLAFVAPISGGFGDRMLLWLVFFAFSPSVVVFFARSYANTADRKKSLVPYFIEISDMSHVFWFWSANLEKALLARNATIDSDDGHLIVDLSK